MQQKPNKNPEIQLVDTIFSFQDYPAEYMMYAFPWGEKDTPLERFRGPDTWQIETAEEIGYKLRELKGKPNQVIRCATGSGHGIGKSAEVGMFTNWAIDTMFETRVRVTANTENQLRTITWPEILKWHHLKITKHWFKITATSMFSIYPAHEKSWRADAMPWSESNPAAFAGLHNAGKRILLIFDESSEIHDEIWNVAEGAMTDEYTQIIWLVFGNRTRNYGKFSECFKADRGRWINKCIDSRKSAFTNKEELQRQIDKYGIDSDFVRVRILGEEPKDNPDQFISQALITAARGKFVRAEQFGFAPVILSCDPAWSGKDDLVISMRQGIYFKILFTTPKNDDDILIATRISNYITEYKADAVFIDLGYGNGIYSALKNFRIQGVNIQLIPFGSKASKPGYWNKRAEMYADVREWLINGGCLPDDQRLCEELSWITAIPRLEGQIQLIDKEDMDASPNLADSLALTFALPVRPGQRDPSRFDFVHQARKEFSNGKTEFSIFSK